MFPLLALLAAGAEEFSAEVVRRPTSAVVQRDGKLIRQVTVHFRVSREGRGVVAGARAHVEEDGVEVAVVDLAQTSARPASIVLALDASDRMAGDPIEQSKAAALSFLDRLDPSVEVGLIVFHHEVRLAERPTADRDRLRKLIRAVKPEGGTAYHDATVRSAKMLTGVPGQRAVVVLTTGRDTHSRASLKVAIEAAQRAELPAYTIGIGEPGSNEPVYTILVLDRSGSMGQRVRGVTKLDAMKESAKRFIDRMPAGGKATLLPFSSKPDLPGPFTDDRPRLKEKVDAIRISGGTRLYDATLAGIEKLVQDAPGGRRFVAALTDGVSGGDRVKIDGVIDRAKRERVPVYTIGFGEGRALNEAAMRRLANQTGGEYHHATDEPGLKATFERLSFRLYSDGIDERSLKALAEQTGGRYRPVARMNELSGLFQGVAEELRTTYEVTFESRRPTFDGTARGIDVKIKRGSEALSAPARVDDVARGIVVPHMSYLVYLSFLAALLALLAVPGRLKRLAGRA